MKNYLIAFAAIICMLMVSSDTIAQSHHNRDHRKAQKTETKLSKAKRDNKIDATENAAIEEKKAKLQRREIKAHHRGIVTPAEDRKVDRAQRQLKREVRRAKRD